MEKYGKLRAKFWSQAAGAAAAVDDVLESKTSGSITMYEMRCN